MEECRPSRKEARAFAGPVITVDDVALVFWKNFYEVLQKYELEDWWRSTSFFTPTQEFPVVSNFSCRTVLTALEKSNYSVGLIL